MSRPEHEIAFETEICEYLQTHGWRYSDTDSGYDDKRAIYPDDVYRWLADTQPEELAKVIGEPLPLDEPWTSKATAEQCKKFDGLLDELVRALDKKPQLDGGTLNVLRKGFKFHTTRGNVKLEMSQAKPPHSLNAETEKRYSSNILRVMRQVHYSKFNQNSIDLVLFLNGIPVATIELKTDFTQSANAAIIQYKNDRNPGLGKTTEPLLTAGRGALVHFALSNTECFMTTKLDAALTKFLPFNLGFNNGAGNPPTYTFADGSEGSATGYMWERVWQKDNWLQILLKFISVSSNNDKEVTIFPRLHQWDVVTKLIEDVKTQGIGGKYLIQHSAGSGKSNSIAWTAHQLSHLMDKEGKPIYRSVIVVTDRNVLDQQLRDTIKSMDGTNGAKRVVSVGDKSDSESSSFGSKSAALKDALERGVPIITVTIQTFPVVLDLLNGSDETFKNCNFAIIADEAHSSQSGGQVNALKAVLGSEIAGQARNDGGDDPQTDSEDETSEFVEDVLLRSMETRVNTSHISRFAFTATPKQKTLELFGVKGEDGVPRAFHVYSMRQAIEERFILDVLKNYVSYEKALHISEEIKRDSKYKEREAMKALINWVDLLPENFDQKAKIIVDHFLANVDSLLGGTAKAMVVAGGNLSRQSAVRFKFAIDKYIKSLGLKPEKFGVLVAFSGEVNDKIYGDKLTEGQLNQIGNPSGKGIAKDIAEEFKKDKNRILIVANKFQTGFDQPKLCAMYLDKKLSGVSTVQTISRLNRIYDKKDKTFVLDFTNDPQNILNDFRLYYEEAEIESETDPNVINELQAKLDNAGWYTADDVDKVAEVVILATLSKSASSNDAERAHETYNALLQPIAYRINDAYQKAIEADDIKTIGAIDEFRKNLNSFVKLYDFLSQIFNYADTDLEKRSIFFKLLSRLIRRDTGGEPIDTSEVDLQILKYTKQEDSLDGVLPDSEDHKLKPITGGGTAGGRIDDEISLKEAIKRINEMYAGDFDEGDLKAVLESTRSKIQTNKKALAQIRDNSVIRLEDSEEIKSVIDGSMMEAKDNKEGFTNEYFGNEDLGKFVRHLIIESLKTSLSAGRKD